MNVSEKILMDTLSQLVTVVETVERFVDWSEAGEDRKGDFDIAVMEAKEALGASDCKAGTCQRN